MSQRVRTFLAVFSVEGTDEHLLPDLAAAIDVMVRSRQGCTMTVRWPSRRLAATAITAVMVVAAVMMAARWVRADMSEVPTMVVEKSTFVNTLEVRGEIRPVRSVVLTAPSSGGSDLQIINIAANGAAVKAGDVVIQFDTTAPQRLLDQRRSDLQTATSEVAEGRRPKRGGKSRRPTPR